VESDVGLSIGVFAFVVARVVDLVGEAGGLEGPCTLLTPAGDGHVFDERVFGGGFGVVFFEVGGEELVEFFLRFAGEDYAFGVEAVREAVLQRGLFALVSGGPGWINSDRYNISARVCCPLLCLRCCHGGADSGIPQWNQS
jgi:hypothetical protein